jgi:hypothetical protein
MFEIIDGFVYEVTTTGGFEQQVIVGKEQSVEIIEQNGEKIAKKTR